MQNLEKASEPSMEDILASIRKIIAEEPAGSRVPTAAGAGASAGGQAAPLPVMRPAMPAAAVIEPAAKPVASVSRPAAFEDDMSDFVEAPAPRVPVAARPSPVDEPTAERAPWSFSPPTTPARAAVAAPALPSLQSAAGSLGAALSGQAAAKPAAHSPAPDPIAELGQVVPGLLGSVRSHVAAPARAPAPAPTVTAAPVAQPAPMPAPIAEPAAALSPVSSIFPTEPVARSAKPVEPPASVASAIPPTATSVLPPAKLNGAHLAQPNVQVSLQRPAVPPPAKPQSPAAVTAAVAEPAPSQSSPAAVAAAAIVQATTKPKAPGATPAAAVAAAGGGRSLEDTVSDLLRPMLREWLDRNMPGLVEKALKSEIKTPGGTDH